MAFVERNIPPETILLIWTKEIHFTRQIHILENFSLRNVKKLQNSCKTILNRSIIVNNKNSSLITVSSVHNWLIFFFLIPIVILLFTTIAIIVKIIFIRLSTDFALFFREPHNSVMSTRSSFAHVNPKLNSLLPSEITQ